MIRCLQCRILPIVARSISTSTSLSASRRPNIRMYSSLHLRRDALHPRSSLPSSSSFRSSFLLNPRRSMFIQTASTPNPLSLKFMPGVEVAPAGTSHDFNSYRDASAKSPLAALLFGIDGVKSVYLAPEFLSINIDETKEWNMIKPEVYAVLMDFYASGKPVVYLPGDADFANPAVSSTTILPGDSEVVSMIKELIETRIRPAVQEDGGDIDYKDFNEATGLVTVQMQGACKGCGSSAITLKNGIENMLMHYVPEVKCVEEYVDEEVKSVSEDAMKKLEEKLAKAQAIDAAIPMPKASSV